MPAMVPASAAPRLAVSACLLGEAVRYDGRDKRDAYVCDILASRYELVSVCPEAGAGLGVPRPAVHLVGDPEAPCAVGVSDPHLDVTPRLRGYIETLLEDLGRIDGAILKARSPSCGLTVSVTAADGTKSRGRGLFAAALVERWPDLPLVDEDVLADPACRDDFLARVAARHRRRTGDTEPSTTTEES